MSKPMPDNFYFSQASLLMHMDRCKQAGYLDSYDYYVGFKAMTYIVNTWEFDEKAFKDKLDESSLPWKNIKATSTWCEGTKKDVDNLIANANNHKKSSAKRRAENQQTMAILAQSLQTITQAASNSVQKMQVGSPAVTPVTGSSYNLNVLPAPIGYESTYVPTGTAGVLSNSSITNGYRLCEYNNGRATRLPMNQQCPTVLNP